MKKSYKIEVDCANCANKIEEKLKKIPGINDVSINFMAQKMIIDINDDIFDKTLEVVIKTAKKVEPDFEIYK